jgi:hypothetical protein
MRVRSLVVLLLLVAGAASHAEDMLVGVLEDVPPAYVGEQTTQAIRVAFRQTSRGWEAFPSNCRDMESLASITKQFPKTTVWTISNEGKTLGEVTAQTPEKFLFYSRIGLQSLVKPDPAPTVGDRQERYSGFMDTPVHRPLIATTEHRVPGQSHGKWSKVPSKLADLESVWPEFLRLIPLIDDCRLDAQGELIASDGRAPRKEELEITSKWGDRMGNAILQVAVRQESFANCDGPSSYSSQIWFFTGANGHPQPLPGQMGSDQNGLVLPLGFFDLAGDGRDEAVFLLAGYDRGGYAIYYDHFQKLAVVSWSYH